MKFRRLLTVAAVLFAATLLAAPDAEARRGWRKTRWTTARPVPIRSYQPRTQAQSRTQADLAWRKARRPSTGPVTYSGISRAEQDAWRRREAWYNEAYNGFRPGDFR